MSEKKFERQANGYYLRVEANGTETWIKGFYGHVGFIKEAIYKTEGLELYGQQYRANQPGMSNPDVLAYFPGGPDGELERLVWVKYHELYEKAALDRKNGTGKPKIIPRQIRHKRSIPVRTFLVSVDTKRLWKDHPEYRGETYPTWEFCEEGLKRDDAKDLFEARYNQEYAGKQHHNERFPLGWAAFYLKAIEKKA